MIPEHDDITAGIHDARYLVARAKVSVFESECMRLAGIAQRNPQRRREIISALRDIAWQHDLPFTEATRMLFYPEGK